MDEYTDVGEQVGAYYGFGAWRGVGSIYLRGVCAYFEGSIRYVEAGE